MMPEGVSQWVWASDFHGFGYRDLDPRMARIFLHVSAEHYPERLVRCLPPAGTCLPLLQTRNTAAQGCPASGCSAWQPAPMLVEAGCLSG